MLVPLVKARNLQGPRRVKRNDRFHKRRHLRNHYKRRVIDKLRTDVAQGKTSDNVLMNNITNAVQQSTIGAGGWRARHAFVVTWEMVCIVMYEYL